MKSVIDRYVAPGVMIVALVSVMSCAAGHYLKTETTVEPGISGVYTLYLYGAGLPYKLSILDIEKDDYTFEIFASRHNYTVETGVPADTALQEAKRHIGNQRRGMRRILSDDGKVIGYELRPLYQVLRYGYSDILDVDYRLAGKNVIVSVDVKSPVQKTVYRDLYGGE